MDIFKNTKEVENLITLESTPGDGTIVDLCHLPNKKMVLV